MADVQNPAVKLMTPEAPLRRVIERNESCNPLPVRELIRINPVFVSPLFNDALIECEDTPRGIVVILTAAALYQPEKGQRRVQNLAASVD